MQHKTVSLADQVFDQLEADILSGVYAKGDILTELKLCESLGVSRTPVREALRRLLQEHLLEETGKGCLVLGISKEDLCDIYAVRTAIEPIAAAKAAVAITREELTALKEILDLQEFYVQKQDTEQIREMDSRFHDLLYRASHSVILYDTLSPLHKKVQKYRGVSVKTGNRAAQSLAEHKAVFNALQAGDAQEAHAQTAGHIANAYKSILKEGRQLWD